MEAGYDSSQTVIFFGDFDYSYPRERTFKRGLLTQGVQIRECRFRRDRTLIGWRKIALLLPAYFVLTVKAARIFRAEDDIDYVLAMRNNQLLLPLAKLVAILARRPLVFDAFDSNFHSAKLKNRRYARAVMLWVLEYMSLRIPNRLIATTAEFAQLYADTYGVSTETFTIVPPGADEEVFPTAERNATSDDGPLQVTYWGNFHAHHGVETIVDSAQLLDSTVQITLIGDGLRRTALERTATRQNIANVEFIGRVADDELVRLLKSTDVCLGIFSDHRLARCSITNKVCEALSMGKPVVTRTLPQSVGLRSGEHLLTVEPESPDDLASALVRLRDDVELRNVLARNGNAYFADHLSERAIGRRLADLS